MRHLWLLLASAAAAPLLAAQPASAQSATAKAAPTDAVSEVVVVGQKAPVKASIDRRTYTVGRDLQGSTGSVGDVLRNLPSVEVDLEGNIALRGDANVHILIDGQPSRLMSGPNRATALQQLPANTVESIEIITNPSAQFAPDGAAGVINIVTKKSFKPGRTGTLVVNAGSEGRYSASLSGAMKLEKLTLNAGLYAQRPSSKQEYSNFRRSVDPVTGLVREIDRRGVGSYNGVAIDASIGADYDFSATSRLSARLSHNRLDIDPDSESSAISTLGGVTIRDYDRLSPGIVEGETTQGTLAYRRTFAEPGREFTLNLSYGASSRDNLYGYANIYRFPLIADEVEERRFLNDNVDQRLAAAYTLPLASGGKIVAGYELNAVDIFSDTYGGLIDPTSGVSVTDPRVTNQFDFGQTIHAGYVTYQRPMERLTVMAGLRLEQTIIDTNLVTTGEVEQNDYFGAYPSLHLQYDLTENQKLTASYSRRIGRPGLGEYNPFLFYRDEFSIGRGNPRLKPQQTHSFEMGWRTDKPGRMFMANVYVRKTYDAFGPISTFYSPTILLNTVENVGTALAGGAEFTATGRLTTMVSYNAGADLFYREIDVSYLGGPIEQRSGVSYTLKSALDFRLTSKDLLQLNGQYSGRAITPQGHRVPFGTLNIGYRRTLRDDLFLTFTVADALRTTRNDTVLDIPQFLSINRQSPLGRMITVGFTRQFGGKARESQFDYSGGGGGGAAP